MRQIYTSPRNANIERVVQLMAENGIETSISNRRAYQGADWKRQTAPGGAMVDPDVRRSVNWPTQLICYFAGKEQILALKADYRKKLGADYSERRFHDELLALGSVPYVFARAKMLGEPVPDF